MISERQILVAKLRWKLKKWVGNTQNSTFAASMNTCSDVNTSVVNVAKIPSFESIRMLGLGHSDINA